MKFFNKTGHQNPHWNLKHHEERIATIFGRFGTGESISNEMGIARLQKDSNLQINK